jgi:hypothetical protein
MASIEQLLGHSTNDLEAMTTEELLVKFKDVFDLEKKLIDEGALKVIADTPDEPSEDEVDPDEPNLFIKKSAKPARKSAAEKAKEKMDAVKAQLLELENLTKEL